MIDKTVTSDVSNENEFFSEPVVTLRDGSKESAILVGTVMGLIHALLDSTNYEYIGPAVLVAQNPDRQLGQHSKERLICYGFLDKDGNMNPRIRKILLNCFSGGKSRSGPDLQDPIARTD